MTRANTVLMLLGILGAIMVAGEPAFAQEKPADTMEFVLEKIRAVTRSFWWRRTYN